MSYPARMRTFAGNAAGTCANCRSLKARLSSPEPVASKGILSLRLRGARPVSASLCGAGAPFLVAPSMVASLAKVRQTLGLE